MREQAWSIAGHIFVTMPVDDTEQCCRVRVYRRQGRRLERVVLPGGLGFEVEDDTYRAAVLKLVHRLERYFGEHAESLPSINLRPLVREGTWTLAT